MPLRTIEYLSDPALARLYWPSITTGLAVALFSAPLSVLVVLKRLAFIGQGVSHAAFGGVGVAALLASLGLLANGAPQFLVIYFFCLAAALLIGVLSRTTTRGHSPHADTAIGIVLVASMALGAILLKLARSGTSWESFLFGSIVGVDWPDTAAALAVTFTILAALLLARRPLLFWSFDPPAAQAFGVGATRMNLLLLCLLALAIVTAMKLAGVVLATALLVLPGAVALALSTRLAAVLLLAALSAILGVVLGLFVSFEFDLLPGPSIVLALTLQYAATPLLRARPHRRSPA